jgi:uncharacterized GH25 family protein
MKTIPIVTLLLCAALVAPAHDLFLMPSTFSPAEGTTITLGLHVGHAFPNSNTLGALERFKEPKLIWKSGSTDVRNLRADGKRIIGDAVVDGTGTVIAAVWQSTNVVEMKPASFTRYLEGSGLTDIVAWREQHGESDKQGKERYSKYVKAILVSGKADGFANHPVGYVIEIIPEADPNTLKPGDVLPIQVLFRGKPAAGLQIETTSATTEEDAKDAVIGKTGPDGRLKVPLPNRGYWNIKTIKMERCTDPSAADWESFWASLTFQIR